MGYQAKSILLPPLFFRLWSVPPGFIAGFYVHPDLLGQPNKLRPSCPDPPLEKGK